MAAIVWKEAESLDANGRIYTCLRGIITPPPIAERSIVMIASVLFVSVRDHIFGTTRPIFTELFVHVTYGRGSVLLGRRSDSVTYFRFCG